MGKLDGRVALVTGGSSGIGFATAQEFVGEGAHVFLTGRREKELAAAVKEIGRNVADIRADVSNSQDLDRLFSQIKNEKGKLDIVFANAGAAKYAPLGQISEELYQSIFDRQSEGRPVYCSKGTPSNTGRRINHTERVDRRQQRPARKQCLQRHEGGGTLVCPNLDDGLEGPAHPCECRESWFHRHGGF